MVWFHGGGNMRGSDRLSYYDGSSLAHHNVVVVTAQYRVGILGFLALPELIAESPHHSAGNYGLLDQIQALRWVQQNIAQFGGDPHRITAFGESSGAADIACMMTSPLARGAMQQAIMESGSAYYDIADLKTAAAHGTEVESKLGLTSLAALRGASAEQLLHSGAAFDTIVDGWILPEFPATAWQEHHVAPLPVIIGTNHDEGSAQPNPPSTVADYEERLKYIFGALYPEALQIFPCTEDEQATATIDRVLTTVQYAAPARRAARTLQAAGDTHVYRYLFSKIPPGRVGEVLGAGHGTELAYVFGSFRRPIEEHVALSNIMQEAWTQFAATSDPSTASVPWPAYQADTDEVLEFGDTVAVKSGWLRAECDLADKRP
jgi:para-nitrobenzyl esterase